MKKAAMSFLLLLILSSVGFAQIGISKGIIGGLNLATVSGSDVSSNVKSLTGYAAGVYLELNIPGPFSIEAEGLYSVKGSKSEVAGTASLPSRDSTTTLAYVDIPVLLKYHLPVPAISACLYAGPMYSTLLSATVKGEGTGFFAAARDIKDQLAASDFGLVFGAGLGFSSLRIDARYNMGLSALDKDGKLKMYNRVIALYVGLSL